MHMYCSEAPCGDASMELIIAGQEDATPWPIEARMPRPREDAGTAHQPTLHGRAFFSQLGIVRRKPCRSDAPPTLSKSCSDKLSLKQCTSLLSSPTALLITPTHAYLRTLVLRASQYSAPACARAFGCDGRMAPLKGWRWGRSGYAFQPFTIGTTGQTPPPGISRCLDPVPGGAVPCNLSVAWTPHFCEVLINGVRQGRKQSDPAGASVISRRRLCVAVAEVVAREQVPPGDVRQVFAATGTYLALKQTDRLAARREAKVETIARTLMNWQRNEEDDFMTGWELD
ncbi:MAG: hypothetical protein M1826_001487 [Phylliscum demangeonii]|nr:MAG: hypothetical protein M1826_001487 [Phylliscum demangeonii]